jgi:hypothetical protein
MKFTALSLSGYALATLPARAYPPMPTSNAMVATDLLGLAIEG